MEDRVDDPGLYHETLSPKTNKKPYKETQADRGARIQGILYILLSEGLNFIQHVPESYDTISNGGGRTGFSPCS